MFFGKNERPIYCADCGSDLGNEAYYLDCDCGSRCFTFKDPKYNGEIRKQSMEDYLAQRRKEWKLPHRVS